MVITIIGLGETGTAIAHELLVKYQSIRLNIIDTNDNLDGRLLDLAHAGVANNNRVAFRNPNWFQDSSFIFFCAGTRNKPGEAREQMAEANKKLIHTIFGNIEFTNEPTIIVISNPVDAMTSWIAERLKGKASVIGTGTLLDTWRLKLIIADKFNVDLENIETAVVGEHGDTMVVLWSHTTINGEFIMENYGPEDLSAIEEELRSSAKRIRMTENATKYGVGAVAVFLLDLFRMKTPTRTIASVCASDGMAYGQFCYVSSQEVRLVHQVVMTSQELQLLKESVAHISAVVNG